MWVKTVKKPTLLQMNAPDDFCCYDGTYLDADATVYLLANNQVGFLTHRDSTTGLIETDYSAEGIRKELLGITLNHDYGAIVFITPTKQATFKNLVDIIDELGIVGHIRYKLTNYPADEERTMLTEYGRYLTTRPTAGKRHPCGFVPHRFGWSASRAVHNPL